MSIIDSDLVEYLSTDAGSTGGAISGSSVTSGVPNNVWANVTDSERVAGTVVYRKTFWKNNNGSAQAAVLPILYTPTLPTYATLEIGLGFDSSSDNDYTLGNMASMTGAAHVALVSSAADTRVATIYGMDNAGTPAPLMETVSLTGTSEAVSSGTFSKVWAVRVASTSATNTVTIKQGSGGATIGVISPYGICCWLWVSGPTTAAAGIKLPDLSAGSSYGLWRKLTIGAGQSAERPCAPVFRIEEGA